MSKKQETSQGKTIALNRKARHDYAIEQCFEAGLMLKGWEVKSLRAGRAQLKESYVKLKNGEVWLIGCHISPLDSASTHVEPDPTRTRKLLLNLHEISKLIGAVERSGYTLVPLALYWKKAHVKIEIALAKGKKEHDKRQAAKDQEWSRQKDRLRKTKFSKN